MVKPIRTFTVTPSLPPELDRQRALVYNLRWAWNHEESLSDATWEIHLRQRDEGGVLCGESDSRRLALDTGGDLAATARAASDWLRLLSSETISASVTGGGER